LNERVKNTRIICFLTAILAFCAFSFSAAAQQAKLPSSPIRTVYITPLSHYDFGFVEPPDAVRERAARHIDEVIRVAETHPNFKWTIESVWQVNEWLKRQKKSTSVLPKDKEKIARLMNLIKSGRLTLSTSWGSMHTDFMGAEELNRLVYDYARLARTYGIKSETALLDDVPGHPTSLPTVLAGSGTKYLVTGANLFINQATSLAPGKVPFYWQAPDGSRVLTWVSQGRRGGTSKP
jgi:Glycosyl hydrolases family 38 N-terminal domain